MNSSTSSSRSYLAALLAVIGGAAVAALLVTEGLVRRRVEPNDALMAHVRMFHAARQRSAALGDSHTACGLAPPDGMVNLAFLGENIHTLRYKAGAYFSTWPAEEVIVQADAHMFAPYRSSSVFADYDALFDRTRAATSTVALRSLASYHRPKLFAYWDVWFHRGDFRSRTTATANGWMKCNEEWNSQPPDVRLALARDRAKLHGPMRDVSAQPFAAEYRGLLEDLLHRGARACLVEFPVTHEYQQEISRGNYQLARDWFRTQARELGIPYLAHGGLFVNKPNLFSDTDHLNEDGARRFSALVLSQCFGRGPSHLEKHR